MERTQANLIERLKQFRAKRKMSHSSLAKLLGIHPNTLGQWLCEHRKLRQDECVRIEKLIGPTVVKKDKKPLPPKTEAPQTPKSNPEGA